MIHAKNLMIGDWLFAIGDDGKKHICRANDIKQDPVNNTEDFSVDFFGTDFDPKWPDIMFNVEPIPLTPEILEKNGFTRFGTDYILEGEHFRLENPSDPSNYLDNYWLRVFIRAVHIEYVHELQHALRLCGIEKEIEL